MTAAPPPTVPPMGTVGIWTTTLDALPAAAASDAAAELEQLGFGTLWFGEAYGRDALGNAALFLGATSRMTVATGIANVYGRDAVAMNAGARLLRETSGGRFLLGLGVSHQPLVERTRGHAYAAPVATMRAYLEAMDRAPYLAHGAELPRPPRFVAALGPKMLELSRELADGAHPYLGTVEHTAGARAALGPDRLLAVEQGVVLGESDEEYLRRAHAHLEIYTGLPNYRNNWLRLGFDHSDLGRGGSERLARALVVHGLEALVQRVREHLAAGADHVCVQVLGTSPFDPPREGWRELAGALPDLG